MMSMVSVGLMCVAALWWSAPRLGTGQLININLSQGTNYTQPIYCSATVSGLTACMPSACYWSGSRSQCCMFRNTSASGILFDQCLCNGNVNCSVATATAPFVYTVPLYCPETTYATTYTKGCLYHDACLNSTTRGRCCSRVTWANNTQVSANMTVTAKCYCTADVTCVQ